jgi:hypothetical protein
LKYWSLFNNQNEETQYIHLTEFKDYEIRLCIDYVRYSVKDNATIIDQLKEGESYWVKINETGCGLWTKDSCEIKRRCSDYEIYWGEKRKKLNQKEVQLIRYFEIDLRYNSTTSGTGSTSVDYYTLLFNNHSVEYIDAGNNWRGWYYLMRKLF